MGYTLHFGVVWNNLDRLLAGLALGLGLAVAAVAIGTLAGIVLAFAGTGRVRPLRHLASGYVTIVRNTPILVIVLVVTGISRVLKRPAGADPHATA